MFCLASTLLFSSLVSAQLYGGGGGGSPATTTSAAAAAAAAPSAPADTPGHVNIDVAFNNGFVFHPANVTASNGTLVTFWFPNNGLTHSVTQSSFAAPCTFLAANGSSPSGFDSGLTAGTQFSVNITDDTKPIWFHCKQVDHCGMGMVGSVNAPSTGNTFESFQAAAMSIGSSETQEKDNGAVTGGVNGVATAAPATMSAAAGSSSTGSSSSSALRLIASIPLAVLAAVVVLVL
ncbi:Cupredoxin [Desarmillaria tabescens]|uniref:Cupredoxin n=1 Tax=Armillaria tabescens TaxID=1929756 RepID=A0AA39N647_ARMTA|nr:Cupredoxin [Desarmillaria tabescens]KAK0459481.1 Cupredoxin [Desarmillaria tabescens]